MQLFKLLYQHTELSKGTPSFKDAVTHEIQSKTKCFSFNTWRKSWSFLISLISLNINTVCSPAGSIHFHTIHKEVYLERLSQRQHKFTLRWHKSQTLSAFTMLFRHAYKIKSKIWTSWGQVIGSVDLELRSGKPVFRADWTLWVKCDKDKICRETTAVLFLCQMPSICEKANISNKMRQMFPSVYFAAEIEHPTTWSSKTYIIRSGPSG